MAMLRAQPRLDVVSRHDVARADSGAWNEIDAFVVATDMAASGLVSCLSAIAGPATGRIVLIINDGYTVDLFNAVEHGVAARATAPDRDAAGPVRPRRPLGGAAGTTFVVTGWRVWRCRRP